MGKLIGKSHLFCRLKDLREGLLIEHVGNMTLQPDGPSHRFTLTQMRAAGFPTFTVKFLETRLSLSLRAHNNWIPSSTWTQSMGDIPVGFFCDEPEHSVGDAAALPHSADTIAGADCARLSPSPRVCAFMSARSLACFRKCLLRESGLNKSKSSSTGVPRTRIARSTASTTAFTTHDAWEWSTLYEAPLRWKFDYGFLMHDTNVIFPRFPSQRRNFQRTRRMGLPACISSRAMPAGSVFARLPHAFGVPGLKCASG